MALWRWVGGGSVGASKNVRKVACSFPVLLFFTQGALFSALRRCRLIDPATPRPALVYSRAGRTDARVSALGNVVALRLRSRVAGVDGATDAEEIDYIAALNGALPPDVWVTGWAPLPAGFSARFSASGRAYKYYWVEDGDLDIRAMRAAASHLLGTHDFRHVCKPDVPAVVNYVRTLTRLDVDEWPVSVGGGGDGAAPSPHPSVAPPRRFTGVVLTVSGNAFLWHQIRCVAALLLMVGRGQEGAAAIGRLVDLAATPRRPQYNPAPPDPLLLTGASFPGLVWRRSERGLDGARRGVRALLRDSLQRTALLSDAAAALDAHAAGRPHPPCRERSVKCVPLARRQCDPPLKERLAAKGRTIECVLPRRPAAAPAGPVTEAEP